MMTCGGTRRDQINTLGHLKIQPGLLVLRLTTELCHPDRGSGASPAGTVCSWPLFQCPQMICGPFVQLQADAAELKAQIAKARTARASDSELLEEQKAHGVEGSPPPAEGAAPCAEGKREEAWGVGGDAGKEPVEGAEEGPHIGEREGFATGCPLASHRGSRW